MSALSNYLETAIMGWLRGTQMPTPPTALYAALFNGSPTDTGTGGTDVTTTIRAAGRVAVPLGAPADGSSTNSSIVDFGNAAGAARITHVALYDAASGGNLLMHGALTTSYDITAGLPVKFPIGQLNPKVD